MVNSNTFFLLVLIAFISTIRSGKYYTLYILRRGLNNTNNFYLCCSAVSISCYQCNSTDIENQFRCTEFMDTYGLEPKPCTSVYNAAYCVKLVGRYEGIYCY